MEKLANQQDLHGKVIKVQEKEKEIKRRKVLEIYEEVQQKKRTKLLIIIIPCSVVGAIIVLKRRQQGYQRIVEDQK
eukprot:Pgem_evm1s16236